MGSCCIWTVFKIWKILRAVWNIFYYFCRFNKNTAVQWMAMFLLRHGSFTYLVREAGNKLMRSRKQYKKYKKQFIVYLGCVLFPWFAGCTEQSYNRAAPGLLHGKTSWRHFWRFALTTWWRRKLEDDERNGRTIAPKGGSDMTIGFGRKCTANWREYTGKTKFNLPVHKLGLSDIASIGFYSGSNHYLNTGKYILQRVPNAFISYKK